MGNKDSATRKGSAVRFLAIGFWLTVAVAYPVACHNKGKIGVQVQNVPPVPKALKITPSPLKVPAGLKAGVQAVATMSDGTEVDVSDKVAWTMGGNDVIAKLVKSDDKTFKVEGVSKGFSVLKAILPPFNAEVNVEVQDPALVSLALSPATLELPKGTVKALKAYGTFSDGSSADVTSLVSWESASGGKIAKTDSEVLTAGHVKGQAVGSDTIIAKGGNGVTGSASVTVKAADLESIFIASGSLALSGMRQQFSAIGIFSDGTAQDITAAVTWTTSDSGVVAIDPNTGDATIKAPGNADVKASAAAVSQTKSVVVKSASLTKLDVFPQSISVPEGFALSLSVVGTYSDGTTLDLTSAVTWDVANGALASVSQASGRQGTLTGVSQGTTTVKASLLGVEGSTTVQVSNAVLDAIAVSPSRQTLAAGDKRVFRAKGLFSDGSVLDVTDAVSWSVSDAAVAIVRTNDGEKGLVIGVSAGAAKLLASHGGKQGEASLTVTAAKLASIAVTPANVSLPQGNTRSFTATATFANGDTEDVTDYATWTSSDARIALASDKEGTKGQVTAVAKGSVTISAQYLGVTGDLAVGVIDPAAIATLSVVPSSVTMPVGEWRNLGATSSGAGGSHDVTQTVVWASSNPLVATVSNANGTKGRVTGMAAGTATITGSGNGSSATASVTVTGPSLTNVLVSPANLALTVGDTSQLTATGLYSDGTTGDVTGDVTWSSTVPSSASVNSSGLVTSLSAGSSVLRALLSGVTSNDVAVTSTPPLTLNEPTGLILTTNATSAVTLSWTSGGGTTAGFIVAYRAGAVPPADCASNTVVPASTIGMATTYQVTGLAAGTTYAFRVCAVDGNATPQVSTGITGSKATWQDPPNDPSSPSATANSTTAITVSWSAGSGATAYKMSYAMGTTAPANCGTGTQVGAATIGAATSYQVSGLSAGTSYAFRVCSVNGNPTPDMSTGVTATASTWANPPSNPSSPAATADSTTAITVSWTAGAGATAYKMSYATGTTAPANCGTGTQVSAATIGNTTSYQVSGLTAGTSYAFRVCSVNGNPTPDVSTGVTATASTWANPPSNPSSPAAAADSTTAITVSWSAGAGATAYKMSYATGTTAPVDCATGTQVSAATIGNTTSYQVTGLTANTSYAFRVCSVNGNPTPDVSTGVTATASTWANPPSNPSSPTATADSTTAITVSWSAGTGATAYRMSYATGTTAPANCTTGTQVSAATIGNATSYQVTGLSAGTSYAFRVCSVNGNPTPDVSTGVTATTSTWANPPGNPSSPAATADSTTAITVSWTAGSGATAYKMSYATGTTPPADCVAGTQVSAATIGNATSYQVTGLTANTSYAFRVCSVNGNPTPDVSTGVTATTSTWANPPSNPSSPAAAADSTTAITVSWTAGAGATAYKMSYTTGTTAPANCGTGTQVSAATIGNATSYQVTGLTANTSYAFRVCSVNGNPTPDVSTGVTATTSTWANPPSNPSSPSATADSTTAITVGWSAGSGATAYKMSYATGTTAPANCGTGTQVSAATIGNATSYQVTGLTANTSYAFRVCSVNGNPTPDVSTGVTATTSTWANPPSNPSSPVATADSTTAITVSWSAGAGATAYKISYTTGTTAPANCGTGTQVSAAIIGNATSYQVTGLTANTSYAFRVCSVNGNPTPDVSTGVTATATTLSGSAPPNPTSPSAVADAPSQLKVSWTSGGGTTAAFTLSWAFGTTPPASCSSGNVISSATIGAATSYTLTGLGGGMDYAFRICAVDGSSNVSSGVTVVGTTTCFIGETLITMADGSQRRIDEIRVGDWVRSYYIDGTVTVSQVESVIVHDVKEYWDVATSHGRVGTTAEHPFFAGEDVRVIDDMPGFKRMDMFSLGENLYEWDGDRMATFPIVQMRIVPGDVKVYNLHLGNGPATYFANGFAVHNKA